MNPVRVYKTDVDDKSAAKTILDELRKNIPESIVSIDLEDCDKVLRVEYPSGQIDEQAVEQLLGSYGYSMDVLQ